MTPDLGRVFMEAVHKESYLGLARLRPRDAAWLETWINDQRTTRYMATGRTPATVEQIAAQIEAWKEPKDWPFAVLLYGTDPVGTVGLYDVDWITRKAEFRILLGEPHCGKGVGTLVTRMMVDFGFGRLNLNRIWLGVTGVNTRATRAYARAGFVEEGVLVDDLYRDGRYYHSIRMAFRRDAWDTEKAKQVETSAPGPATASPAAAP